MLLPDVRFVVPVRDTLSCEFAQCSFSFCKFHMAWKTIVLKHQLLDEIRSVMQQRDLKRVSENRFITLEKDNIG